MANRAEDFSVFIRNMRLNMNMSQEDLAKELGVSFATINRWETGKNKPSRMAVATLEKFCLQHGLNDLLQGGNELK